jgi:hypothetical protein
MVITFLDQGQAIGEMACGFDKKTMPIGMAQRLGSAWQMTAAL